MGQQLLVQPTTADRHALVIQTAAQVLGGQADLWLGDGAGGTLGSATSTLAVSSAPDLVQRALATQQTELASATQPDSGGAAHVAVPLHLFDTVLGVLEVRREDGPPLDSEEIELLEVLARQAAIGLHAARQVSLARWHIEQLGLVRAVSAQVADVLDLEELAHRVTSLILQTFRYYYVGLFIAEPERARVRRQASAGARGSRPGRVPRYVRFGQGLVGHTAQKGEEILAGDVAHEPRYRRVDALPETRSEVALPLRIEDRTLGVLDVQSDKPDDFDESDMLALRALADNIAIALEDARIYGDLRLRADQLATVAEVTRAVASILDQEALLQQVVALIHERFGYPFVHLFTIDPIQRTIAYRAGSGPRSQALQERRLVYDLDDSEGIIPWVARSGESLLANDVAREPRYRPSELPPQNTRAELAVPLVFGTTVLGVLDIQSDRKDAFAEQDRFLFETLARDIAVAIRNANLYRSERFRRRVADSLREVAGLLSTNAGLDQVLDAILTELERTLPSNVAAIWLLQDGNLCLSAVHGASADVCIRSMSDATSHWLYDALNADRPILRSADSRPEPLGISLGFGPDYSAIAAPLRAGDNRLGLLMLVDSAPGRYGDEARGIASAFASYAAVAIENTRLYRSAQEQAWISTVMLEVAGITQASTDLQQVLESITRLVPMMVNVDRSGMLLLDATTGRLAPVAAYGLSPSQQELFDAFSVAPDEVPALGYVTTSRAPLSLANAPSDLSFPGRLLTAIGFDSPALFPLLVQGEVAGVLLVDRADEQPGLGRVGFEGTNEEDWIAIVQGIAHQTAAAIENAELRRAQQEDAYVSAALLQVAQALASLGELDEILHTVVRITPTLVGVDRCAIFLWDGDLGAFRPAQVYGLPQEDERTLLGQTYPEGSFGLLDRMRVEASVQTYAYAAEDDARDGAEDVSVPARFLALFGRRQAGQRSLLAVPLVVKSGLLGAMLVEEADRLRTANPRRLDIITGIADQAAIAIQDDRLQREMAARARLEQEFDLAREIQQNLMPSELPPLPGWEVAAVCRPARQVGGDFFDVFELPDGRVGLVVGDVADKGMPAALFMALTRALVRAVAVEEASPATVLARVNELMVPDARGGMFVTAILVVLTPDGSGLTYANSGHNLPILWHSHSGQMEWLPKGGLALGVLPGLRLKEHHVAMDQDDFLIIYTDGVTEAYSEELDTFFGEARLVETIKTSGTRSSARAVVEHVEGRIAEFERGAPSFDDLTLIVLRTV